MAKRPTAKSRKPRAAPKRATAKRSSAPRKASAPTKRPTSLIELLKPG